MGVIDTTERGQTKSGQNHGSMLWGQSVDKTVLSPRPDVMKIQQVRRVEHIPEQTLTTKCV